MRPTRELGPRFFASRTHYREVLADIEVQAAMTDWQVAALNPPSRPRNIWKRCSVLLSHELAMSILTQAGV
jgi:hypothetical protein